VKRTITGSSPRPSAPFHYFARRVLRKGEEVLE
jgi:hypothetical protein